jgi:phenylpyruvate tautomerase PptA (4-oxalocrotonate tautomerase family)
LLNREKQVGVVRELTDIVAAAAGDRTLANRTWVLITESPDGGWGINGQAFTNTDIVASARAELGNSQGTKVS